MDCVQQVSHKVKPKLLFIEIFYGGSHKAFLDVITNYMTQKGLSLTLVSLPAKKWHWRARCGALQIYEKVPDVSTYTTLFCSSVLNLTELLGLRPDLNRLWKIVYFHENQLIYPIQDIKSRDVQYAYNQILTCLSADKILFNSLFNKTSFLDNINKILKLLPDNKPKNIKVKIETKSMVFYFPVYFPSSLCNTRSSSVVHIVWPHRWEFDKGPQEFFDVLFKLKKANVMFKISVLGEVYGEIPEIFEKAKTILREEIINFGCVESKDRYFDVLCSSHIAVSTAHHEFFGVSMLEATYCGCFPLVPNRLVYPEIYPPECIYRNSKHLYDLLENFCTNPGLPLQQRNVLNVDFTKYSTDTLLAKYLEFLQNV